MHLQAFSRLTYRQEAFVAWLRAVPDCLVILSVVKGEPCSAKAQGVMLLDMQFSHNDIGDISAAELAIFGACQELGYGSLKITVAAHVVQGWCVGEQSVLFDKNSMVDTDA